MSIMLMLLFFFAVAVTVPSIVLFVEVMSAIYLGRKRVSVSPPPFMGTIAILIPAHNEGINIVGTLRDSKAELNAGDRLLVVADNCTDDTAEIALAEGAEVICRVDPDVRGKGHAIAFGLSHLIVDPPKIVIIVDADCRILRGSLRRLADLSGSSDRPAQALDLMVSPNPDRADLAAASFAWIIKNQVRPLGLFGLGLPCQLAGTGMAIPLSALTKIEIAKAYLAEDLKLGLDLAIAGHEPIFCPSALVVSSFPHSRTAALEQRRRWELGTFSVQILNQIPLLKAAFSQRRANLIALAADLTVPPLVLYLGFLVGGLALTGLASLQGQSILPFAMLIGCLAMFLTSVTSSWAVFGRDAFPLQKWYGLAFHILSKFKVYGMVFSRRSRVWRRTNRDGASSVE